MPKENRKRGKKHKKTVEEPVYVPKEEVPTTSQPSWIVSAPETQETEINPEAPFGYVDADVKAYFRTVDVQIREWQDEQPEVDPDSDLDPNEERRMFFVAALTEMHGKEKELATDPDCSIILERMTYSMDDFVRRVFVDSLAGSYDALIKHRFASHVCQTLFTVAADTVSRESRGIMPSLPESSDKGELRTMTNLILDVCEEILPTLPALLLDPFASHVIRALLLLLSPTKSSNDHTPNSSVMRSKKSAAWKARQGPLKSVFDKGKGKEPTVRSTPVEFRQMAEKVINVVLEKLDENELRAMAANKAACPLLQILLEVEADLSMSSVPGSLMDRVTLGAITASVKSTTLDQSDYLPTLLRDPTSSHLLETLVSRAPNGAFNLVWNAYFQGKVSRLAAHPVANFVLAKALERADENVLKAVCLEMQGEGWVKVINSSRSGVLRALVDRSAALNILGPEIGEAIYSAFNLDTPEDRVNLLFPCVLRLKRIEDYRSALASASTTNEGKSAQQYPQRNSHSQNDPLEPTVQGAVLLQSLLRLPDPHNQLVIQSVNALSMDDMLSVAYHATSSRVLDALLESATVPFKTKRQLVMFFIGNYHRLVDDRIGSRVGDRCWAFADTYLKEKIAKSLVSQEQFLAGSFYGKFFARNLNLYVLQRRPEEWRAMQSERSRAAAAAVASQTVQSQVQVTAQPTNVAPAASTSSDPVKTEVDGASSSRKTKRKREKAEDEIDALFNATLGTKIKKGALAVSIAPKTETETEILDDQVLGAIRAAPKGEPSKHKKARR